MNTNGEQQEEGSQFAAGELNALLVESEVDIARGDVFETDAVFELLRRMSAEQRAKADNGR